MDFENRIFFQFLREANPKQSHQLLIELPPLVGQLVAHGLVVVFLRARDEVVPLIALVGILQERHVHPPLACNLIAQENYIILIITNLYDVPLEIIASQGRNVVLAA